MDRKVVVEYWLQETQESGKWVKTIPMHRDKAKLVVRAMDDAAFSARILEVDNHATMVREKQVESILCEAAKTIKSALKAFGAPGDYGYGSKEGDALVLLIDCHNKIVRQLKTNETVHQVHA